MKKVKITRDSCANLRKLKKLADLGYIEIHDVSFENKTPKVKNKILPVGVYGQTKYGECLYAGKDCKYDEIRSVLGKQNIGDAIKLEAHTRNGFEYFVTEDSDFLRKKGILARKFGIKVISPNDLAKKLNC